MVCLSMIILRIYYIQPYMEEMLGVPVFLLGPFIFLLGPLLYFYLRSIVQEVNVVLVRDWGHFLPFVAYLVIYVPAFILGWDSNYVLLLNKFLSSPWILLIAQLGYYLVHTYRLVKENNLKIVESYSNLDEVDLSWMKQFIWILIAILVFIMFVSPLLLHGMSIESYLMASSSFFALTIFFLAYKALQQGLPDPLKDPGERVNEEYSASLDDMKSELIDHMESHKPYLDPELTLVSLAYQLGVSRNRLSEVINTAIGDNFYHFVNQYRIEEVKKLIGQEDSKKYTIISLANDAGFRSKSSFNAIFKKMTGLTPSEYRNAQT